MDMPGERIKPTRCGGSCGEHDDPERERRSRPNSGRKKERPEALGQERRHRTTRRVSDDVHGLPPTLPGITRAKSSAIRSTVFTRIGMGLSFRVRVSLSALPARRPKTACSHPIVIMLALMIGNYDPRMYVVAAGYLCNWSRKLRALHYS